MEHHEVSSLIYCGTSTWSFPGWAGIVYSGQFSETYLSQKGLIEYSRQPYLKAAGVDRTFYRPMTAEQFSEFATQVPEDFRFLVKGLSQVSDAHLRSTNGAPSKDNPEFLNAELATKACLEPAMQGLGKRLGSLVFQLSPIHRRLTQEPSKLLALIEQFLQAMPEPISLELRNPELLTPRFLKLLAGTRHRLCLALHEQMPPLERQLKALEYLRSLRPAGGQPCPLIVRWTLQAGLGGYSKAKLDLSPFNKLAVPDLKTRQLLARAMIDNKALGTTSLVIINNKAEGCAPLSAKALLEETTQLSDEH